MRHENSTEPTIFKHEKTEIVDGLRKIFLHFLEIFTVGCAKDNGGGLHLMVADFIQFFLYIQAR